MRTDELVINKFMLFKKNVVHALLHYTFEQNSGVYFKYCTYFADLCNTLILCQTEGFWEV